MLSGDSRVLETRPIHAAGGGLALQLAWGLMISAVSPSPFLPTPQKP